MRTKVFLAMLVLFGTTTIGLFSLSPEKEALLRQGIFHHDNIALDPSFHIEEGKKILSPLKDESALALVYYGSILTLESSEAIKKGNPLKSLTLLYEGAKLIDKAVQKESDNVEVRFVRMINSYGVSTGSPVDRYREMKADIDYLQSRRSELSTNECALLDLYRGNYFLQFKKPKEAVAAFESVIAIAPNSKEANEAEKQLSLLSE